MNYQILNEIPINESQNEVSYGKHFRSSCWIRFYNSADDYWYACFGSSENQDKIPEVKIADDFAIIIFNGKLFLINIINKKLILETEEKIEIENAIIDGRKEIIIYPHKDRVVFYNYKSYEMEMVRLDCQSNSISIKYSDENNIYGCMIPFDDYSVNFKIDIDSKKILYREKIVHSKLLFVDKYQIINNNCYANEEYYYEKNQRPTTAST